MAGSEVARSRLLPLWRLLPAHVLGVDTTRVEVAPAGRIRWVGNLSRKDDAVHLGFGVGLGHRRQQGLGVRCKGASGCEQLVGLGQLHHLSDVHNSDPIRDVLDDAEIVGDEQIGEIELRLQVLQKVEDLRLNRHVERRHRLVAHHELGAGCQRASNADALSLAAAERVGVALEVLHLETHHLHQLLDPVLQLLAARQSAGDQRLGDDVEHRHAWIERRVRVLKHSLVYWLLIYHWSGLTSRRECASSPANRTSRGKLPKSLLTTTGTGA